MAKKGGGSPPPAPDPIATANAQTASNLETARANAHFNRVNQITPDGTTRYDTPNDYDWTMTTTLSPENQRLYNMEKAGQGIYGQAALNQLQSTADQLSRPFSDPTSSFLTPWASSNAANALTSASNIVAQPFNTDYNAVRQQAMDAAMSRLNPQFAQDEEAMRSRLLAQGIGADSKAWENEYRTFNQGKNDARMQAVLNAENLANQSIQQSGALRQIPLSELQGLQGMAGNVSNIAGQGLTQALQMRAQPLNETAALLSGQQVGVPQLQQTPMTQQAPTDVIGATMGAYQGQMAGYNAQQQTAAAGLGGAAGLLGTLGMAGIKYGPTWFSDRRLKEDIRKIGKTDDGDNLYSYRYKWEPEGSVHIGVMAQELQKTKPEAVMKTPTGFFAVDYSKV